MTCSQDLVIKTLISVEEPLKADWCKTLGIEDGGWSARGPGGAHRGSCFEIYGFDILALISAKLSEITPKGLRMLSEQGGPEPQAEAVSLFDEVAWELVVEAHDQEMRSGGLEMAFPCPNGSRYVQYWGEESYCNLVLRKWQEAGGIHLRALTRLQVQVIFPARVTV
eukprot:g1535.t1